MSETYKFETTDEHQARLWMNAGRMYGVLHDLLFSDFHRVLHKKEKEFETPNAALEWVEQQIHVMISDNGLSEFMEGD
jgi:hypothetical protein